ncbi:MAG: hypothetical protein RMK57_11400 [Bryobacterales bacterium]|nr:hypothetical protein [Bryobacteraceae bacterium]MDW8355124.1 hypothetical protein [Bryobacterales bacterium]
MLARQRAVASFLFAAGLLAIAISCAPGPPGPKPGTPEFFWNAAKTTWAEADYDKVEHNLDELLKTDNEYKARAQAWRLVVTAGMARGYAELADMFEAGARANKLNPTPFRKQMNDYRKIAGQRALQFAETFLAFIKHDHTQDIPLAFSFPTGSINPVTELKNVANGVLLPEEKLEPARQRTIERSVLLVTCEAVGAPEDMAKAQQIFKAAEVKVPHDVFAVAMVRNLHEQAKLFGRTKLDMPDRVELFCNQALEALKHVKETKETKDLAKKIQETLKEAKRT